MSYLLTFINLLANALYFAVIADVILSYFMSPFHPIRQFLDRIVDPLLAPIRRVVPPLGMFDFSPLILLLLLQFISGLLVRFLASL